MPDPEKPKVFLGFDFGMRRIGVAIGQTLTQTARPLTILAAQDGVPNWKQVQEIIETWRPDGIIVGIPFHMDGSEQETTLAARRFARKINGRFHLPVYEMDERLTTVEAKAHLRTSKLSLTKKMQTDSYAAKLILESWLRENKHD